MENINDAFEKNLLIENESLKDCIKFMELLLKQINGDNVLLRIHSSFVAFCIHRYFNDTLADDVINIQASFETFNIPEDSFKQ